MFVHEGPARVFNSEEEALKPSWEEKSKGDVVVVRYEVPRRTGHAGNVKSHRGYYRHGFKCPLCINYRWTFSGGSNGASVGHVSPEAAEGGPIALLKEGDVIQLDIHKRTLNVKLSDEELAQRKTKWVKPSIQAMPNSYLRRYAALVTSASTGAVMRDDV